MLEPVFNFIEKLSTDFSWKRLVIIMGLVSLIGAVLFLYESQTATSQLSKYERTVKIIENLEKLKIDNQESKKIKENIYSGLADVTDPKSNLAFDTTVPIEIKQALLAAAPWLIFSLFFIPGYFKGNEDAPNIVGGTIALAFIVGIGGYFIPPSWGAWIGFGLYPFGINLLLFAFLMIHGNKTNS